MTSTVRTVTNILLLLLLSFCWQTAHAADGEFAGIALDDSGAVATVNPLATRAGLDALERGGNAIDAAVAAALTLGVVDSHNSGIGGGAFAIVRFADGRIEALDGREMAPAKAHRDMYIIDGELDKSASKTGALASGIPGSLALFDYLIEKAGKRAWRDAFEHGIHYAEQGFQVDPVLHKRLQRTRDHLQQFPPAAAIFLNNKGEPHAIGSVLRQKDLAKSYRVLAKEGVQWFYRGDFAKATEQWMAENGGIINAEDFANYRFLTRQPVTGKYRDLTVVSYPPPSSGGVHIVQMLGMLEPFQVAQMPEPERKHLLAAVMTRAFADRAVWLGDPDYVDVPKGLLDRNYLKARMQDFSKQSADKGIEAGQPPGEDIFGKHTTHIAAADRWGNWVAITTTLNTSFGSKVVIPGTGVLMNNQMDDFSIQPGVANAFGLVGNEANAIAPGKRPLSSMSPTLLLKDGQPFMTLGAAGGPTIITQVLQNIVNVVDLGLNAEQALAAGRIHQQWRPPVLMIEKSMPAELQQALKHKGYKLFARPYLGASQLIIRQPSNGQWQAASEPRIIRQHRDH